GLFPAVDRERHPRLRPRRVANPEGQFKWLGRFDRQSRRVLFGEPGLLADGEALLLPVQLRGDEEVDVEGLIGAEVDRVAVLRMVLHPRADAAPERSVGRGVSPERA